MIAGGHAAHGHGHGHGAFIAYLMRVLAIYRDRDRDRDISVAIGVIFIGEKAWESRRGHGHGILTRVSCSGSSSL